jgi:hypothetical protein
MQQGMQPRVVAVGLLMTADRVGELYAMYLDNQE